jgi:hypothetical protein
MEKNNMQFEIGLTGGQPTEGERYMVVTFSSQTNATKTNTVVPISPRLTTVVLNTNRINRVGLFSAGRRINIHLG